MPASAPARTANAARTAPACSDAPSPVRAAYDRIGEVYPALRVHLAARGAGPVRGEGWVRAAELASGGPALGAYLAWDEEQVTAAYGSRPRPDVTAGFGLHRYAFPLCLLITVPYFLHRRVPRLPVEAVSLRRTTAEMSVDVQEFACLPGDPARHLPGARVVAGEEELRAEVRGAVADHLGPVLDGFGPRLRRGARALWGMATDEIVEGLWYLGHLLGEEQRARAEAELLLPGGTAPYAGGASFRELTGPQGQALTTRDRASCCFFYTVSPENTCVTCPRTCDADRIARLS